MRSMPNSEKRIFWLVLITPENPLQTELSKWFLPLLIPLSEVFETLIFVAPLKGGTSTPPPLINEFAVCFPSDSLSGFPERKGEKGGGNTVVCGPVPWGIRPQGISDITSSHLAQGQSLRTFSDHFFLFTPFLLSSYST